MNDHQTGSIAWSYYAGDIREVAPFTEIDAVTVKEAKAADGDER